MNAFLMFLAHPVVNFLMHLALFQTFVPDVPGSALLSSVAAQVKKTTMIEVHHGFTVDSLAATEMSSEHATELAPVRRLEGADYAGAIVSWIVNLIIFLGIYVVCLYIYKSMIHDKRAPFEVNPAYSLAGGDWKYTTFDCFGDCTYCLYGCCCTLDRLADNMGTVQVVPFWTGGLSWIAMYVLSQIFQLLITIIALEVDPSGGLGQAGSLGYYIGNGLYTYWLVKKIAEMRKAYGDPNPESKCFMDCICMWCCGCCEIIRHARHIDESTGTKVECCFKLRFTGAPNATMVVPAPVAVVGQPIHAQPVVVQATPVQVGQPVQAVAVQPKEA